DVLDRAGAGLVDAPDIGTSRPARRRVTDDPFLELAHRKAPFGFRTERFLPCEPIQRPASIAGRKTSVPGARRGRAVQAGPGQKPPMPQPMPKRAAPVISGRSMRVFVGTSNVGSSAGAGLRQTRR